MNAGIILSGQPLNTLAALNPGTTAARNTNQVRQENALTNLYQTQGPGLMAGDPTALNALSRLNPEAAFGLRADQERLQLAQEAGRRAAASAAASQSAAERAAQEEQIRRGLDAARTAQTPEEWDALAAQFGADELVGQFGQRDAVIAFYEGYSEPAAPSYREFDGDLYAETPQGLEMAIPGTPEQPSEPASIAALRIRAQEAGLEDGTPEYMDFMLRGGSQAQAGTTVYDPETGRPLLDIDGGAGTSNLDLNNTEALNTGFALRAGESHEIITGLEGQGLNMGAMMAQTLPLGVGNYMVSPEYQQYAQAQRDFVNAVLRRESGAVISDQEFANAAQQYFPQPGDSPEVIEQKRRNRETAIQGMRIGAGAGIAALPQQQPTPQADQPPEQPESVTGGDPRMNDDGQIPFSALSDREARSIRRAVQSGRISVEDAQNLFPGFNQ